MSSSPDIEKSSVEHQEHGADLGPQSDVHDRDMKPALSFSSQTVSVEDRDEAYDFLKSIGDKSPWTDEEERYEGHLRISLRRSQPHLFLGSPLSAAYDARSTCASSPSCSS